MSGDLETALSKIRPHTNSSLPHQKAPANLLVALEATFKEQNAERTPAAYFAGLLTALESTVENERNGGYALEEADILPAELYMLALVCPYVPAPVIRANMNTLLAVTSPLWSILVSHPPPLRSQLGLYNAILRAADRSQLESHLLRQSFVTILQFCLDPRPKVRKRAADLVRDVLSSPPSPLLRHPYAERTAEWTLKALADVESISLGKQKVKKNAEDFASSAIHLLSLLRPLMGYLPPSTLPSITSSLLLFPRLGNPFLSHSAYSCLIDLLSFEDDPAMRQADTASPVALLQAIMSQAPLKTDTNLIPPWVALIGKAMLALRRKDQEAASTEVPQTWKQIFPYLESSEAPIRRETGSTLSSLLQCISHTMIDDAFGGSQTVLASIITQLTKALDTLSYVRAMPELLSVISALIVTLRYRPGSQGTPTAAERLLPQLIVKIGGMRIKSNFEYKEAADGVLRTAMAVMGPEVLLSILPLNIMPEDRAAGGEARAFLLPLLSQTHPSPLGHFIRYFVPLTEQMFDLQQKAEVEDRPAEAKVWNVLVTQVWNGLPAYCYRTPDLEESLTPQFAQMLSQLLYNQSELRPPVLRALKVLVESNTAPSDDDDTADTLSQDQIDRNLVYLRSQAESWFAVLFNVFGTVGRDSQNMVGEVISAWAKVAGEKEMAKTGRKVIDMLKASLNKLASTSSGNGASSRMQGDDEQRTAVANMQDILVLLVPHLSAKDSRTVFDLSISQQVLTAADNGVQKRAYKLAGRILQSDKLDISNEIEELFAKLDEVSEQTLAAAKKDRLAFLKLLISQLPSGSLHIIPSLIPESVLATKEPSEKARVAAFELVVALGYKMKEGGVVQRNKLDGMEDDDMGEAQATVQEFFTMMAAGLAGASPHMISATITAMSRLIFEFKDDISPEMHTEIFLTFLEYVKSANREIVKSALGYTKLFIHTASVDLLRPHLDTLVPTLLNWAHDHKNHFKAKVRHIFERLIRRVGWDAVYAAATSSGEDGAKVLLNIKKRKDRAKRKKAQARDADGESVDGDAGAHGPATTGNAFEDVLYGSESEIDESDEEEHTRSRAPAKKGKDFATGARLRVDDDEPMDLLRDASTRVVNRKAVLKPKTQDFKKDEETGKLIINSDSGSEAGEEIDEDAKLAGAAYQEALTSVDGFTRDARGRVKFNKDTKKRRRDAMDLDEPADVDMPDASVLEAAGKNKKQKKKVQATKIGHEFKAKRAGGDIKKGGVDPYAYLSLSQAAKGKKGKGAQRITVTGKR